jgi:hypothetical protein
VQLAIPDPMEETNFVPGYYFVRRKELNELYRLASDARGDESRHPTGARRGPKPAHDWKKHAGREISRRASAGESAPAASMMCQWCVEQLGHHPDIGDMSDLIRSLLYQFD